MSSTSTEVSWRISENSLNSFLHGFGRYGEINDYFPHPILGGRPIILNFAAGRTAGCEK